MKLRTIIMPLCPAVCLLSSTARAAITYDIQAFIDGRDLLIMQGNSVQWDHLDHAAVGRYKYVGSGNEPTIISSSVNGGPVSVDYWTPTWPEPPPAEIRYPAFSSIGTLNPALPNQPMPVTLNPIVSRYSTTIYQYPTAANGYTLIIDFNDDPPPGPAWYEAQITIGAVPEPSTIASGLGALGFVLMSLVARFRPLKISNNIEE